MQRAWLLMAALSLLSLLRLACLLGRAALTSSRDKRPGSQQLHQQQYRLAVRG